MPAPVSLNPQTGTALTMTCSPCLSGHRLTLEPLSLRLQVVWNDTSSIKAYLLVGDLEAELDLAVNAQNATTDYDLVISVDGPTNATICSSPTDTTEQPLSSGPICCQ